MAIQVERMVAILEARLDKYEKGLAKAANTTNRQFTAIERRGKAMETRLANIGAGIGKNFLGALAAGASLRGAQQLIDAATRIENALKVAGLSGDELTKVYDRLFESAQKNAAPVEALVELYGRASLVQKELGVTSEQLLDFTNNIALALRVSGKSAAESSGAILQLSQALGSGVVRAEEFNSILEGAPTILQAAAAGIKEAGGSVAKLRQLMLDGELSSRALFDGFAAGSRTLEEKVAGSTFTVAQQLEKLRTALINAAGQFDHMSGTSEKVGASLERVEGIINSLSNVFEAAAEGPMAKYLSVLEKINYYAGLLNPVGLSQEILGRIGDSGALDRLADKLGSSQGPQSVPVAGGKGSRVVLDPVQKRIDQAHGLRPEPISLKDPKYQVTGDGKGGGRSKRSGENEYQREIAQIKERTAAIQAETTAMAGINPLLNDYGFAIEKATAAQELLTAAKRAGITVTPELRAQIDELAGAYAMASVESAKLAEEQDRLVEAMEDMRDLGKDVLGGFIQDMMNGQSAADALAGALAKVGDKLLEISMNELFGQSGSGSGGGILGGLLGSLFGRSGGGGGSIPWGEDIFRAAGGPVRAGQPYIVGERRPELFVPNQSGSILPAVPQIPKMTGGQGQSSTSIIFAPTIDARGASVEAVARLEQVIAKQQREFSANVVSTVRKMRPSNVKV